METRRTTRSLRGQQSAYEDQARVIQERITTCRQAYRDARDVLPDLRRQANDDNQRKSQLSDRLLSNLLQLQAHYAVYDTAVSDWADLMETHNIAHEDSDWAESMRRQHDHFFALAPTLDVQFRELITIYSNYHDRVQLPAASETPSPELGKGLQPAPTKPVDPPQPAAAPIPADGSDNVSTDTNASNGAEGEPRADLAATANSAVQTTPREDPEPGAPPMANSAMEDDPGRTLTRTDSAAATIAPPAAQPKPRQRVRILEAPDEIHEFDNVSLRSEEATTDSEFYYDAAPVHSLRRTTAHHRSSAATHHRGHTPTSYGLFAMDNGLNFHTGNGRHHETVTYGPPPSDDRARDYDFRRSGSRTPLSIASQYAASAAPAARTANSAVGNARTALGSSHVNPSPPAPRVADDRTRYDVHRDRLRHVLRDAAPHAGRGRYSDFTSAPAATAPVGPPPAAWTTQPPASTAYIRPRSPPPPPPVDHGVDFGRENASEFYQNATYQRISSTSSQPLILKELAIQKFGGDIRAYPTFRNHFLELVEGRKDIAPRHKFQYLLQCLCDEPLQEASRYMITDDNYFTVIDRLETKYGNRRRLLMHLNQSFIDLKPPTQHASDARRFHDEARHPVDEMKQIGEDADKNPVWAQMLVTKMPPLLRQKVFEKITGDPRESPVSQLLARLSDHLRTLEATDDFVLNWSNDASAAGNSGRSGQLCRADPRSTAPRAGTYAAEADATYAANTKRRACTFCGRDHWASRCDIYTAVAQRMRRLQQLGFCFLCLRGGHWIGTCPKRTTDACNYCHNGQHNRALCKELLRKKPQPFASARHSPVPAPTPGLRGILKNERGSSSQQESRGSNPVTRAGVPDPPTAKTVRLPSAHHSSTRGEGNSKKNKRKKSKDQRTDPQGRAGTTRPTTASVHENVTQMDANACGGDGLLLDHQRHLTTDRRSTTTEAPWDDRTRGDGSGRMRGIPDTPGEWGPLDDEEASLPPSTGHCSDADTEPSADEPDDKDPWFATTDQQEYSGYAVSTSSPADTTAVLLECLKTTAVNTNNGLCRTVIVFFDSGSNTSYIDMKLARDLRLPCLEKRCFRVNTFGTDTTTTIAGFATTVLLRSPHGSQVSLIVTASDRIVPPVTTALLETDEVALLQGKNCSLVSTREKPDLLIGQDMVHLFDRNLGPKLPNGFYVVWSGLGPMVGGAGKVAINRKAASTTIAAAATDPEPSTNSSTMLISAAEQSPPRPTSYVGYNPEDPLNLWTIDDPALGMAYSAIQETEEPRTTHDSAPGTANCAVQGFENEPDATEPAVYARGLDKNDDVDLFGDFPCMETAGSTPLAKALYGTTASTTRFLELSSRQPRVQWIRQRSLRKKRNPLDTTTEPLPPTSSTTLAVAAVAGAANSAAQPPRLSSEPILPREMAEKYDRWPRLVRIQYYVVRFAAACLRRLKK